MRRPQRRDGGEQPERRLSALEVDRQDGRPALSGRGDLREGGEVGKGEQALQELRRLSRAVRDGVGLHAAEEVERHLLPVDDERAQPVGGHERDGKVHGVRRGRPGAGRPGEELDEAARAGVGAQEIPPPIHDERRIRLLLRQHVVQRAVHLRELRGGERALAPCGGEAGGQQQGVLLAKGDVQHHGEPQDHLPARSRAPRLEEAHVALGGLGGAGQVELREAAAGAPPAQPRAEAGRRLVHGRGERPGSRSLLHQGVGAESSRPSPPPGETRSGTSRPGQVATGAGATGTSFSGRSPRAARRMFSAMSVARASSMPSVQPDTWGVMRTLGSS